MIPAAPELRNEQTAFALLQPQRTRINKAIQRPLYTIHDERDLTASYRPRDVDADANIVALTKAGFSFSPSNEFHRGETLTKGTRSVSRFASRESRLHTAQAIRSVPSACPCYARAFANTATRRNQEPPKIIYRHDEECSFTAGLLETLARLSHNTSHARARRERKEREKKKGINKAHAASGQSISAVIKRPFLPYIRLLAIARRLKSARAAVSEKGFGKQRCSLAARKWLNAFGYNSLNVYCRTDDVKLFCVH